MGDISFNFATSFDLEEILNIASKSSLNNEQPAGTGFLISQYTLDDYNEFLLDQENEKENDKNKKTIWLMAAKTRDGMCVGFLLAYLGVYATGKRRNGKPRVADGDTSLIVFDMLGKHVPFVIIKQLCIEPEYRRKGIGKAFYNFFYTEICPDRLSHSFAAIVAAPRNNASEAFHKAMGFTRTLQSCSKQSRDEATYSNFIWHKPVNPYIVTSNILEHKDRNVDVIRDSHNKAQELYLHEDNLNWKKKSFRSLLLFAQIAAEWSIILRWISDVQFSWFYLVSILIAGGVGFAAVWLCVEMINSGRMFMANHKATGAEFHPEHI
ncbi:MAG: GNAT family N-acetyltransferase [Rhodomicrobium sp.]|nr:GNAT family N-acetyltransferase [Rhodomicrobium sp.]